MSSTTSEKAVDDRGDPPPATLDIEAYCTRIGYTGERTLSLDTLQALIRHHTQTIP